MNIIVTLKDEDNINQKSGIILKDEDNINQKVV